MCFVHKPMQNADFGQISCRRASTKRRVTSRPTVRFSQTWYQKMHKTWKKKVMKRRVAICGGREAVADFVQGGGQIDPPPPVKIGLNFPGLNSHYPKINEKGWISVPPGISLREIQLTVFLANKDSWKMWNSPAKLLPNFCIMSSCIRRKNKQN